MRALHLRYPRRRWVVVSAIVVLLAAGGAVWWARSAGSSSANNPTYRLVAASTGTIRQSISSTGTIAPAQQDAVSFSVSGKVTRKIKGGLLVDIGVPVFLPASQVDIRRPADIGEYIGRSIDAEILKIDLERRNIVISRRKLLEKLRAEAKQKLFAVRAERVWPGRDEKILTAWNGLMIAAFAKAGAAFGDGRFVGVAATAADWCLTHLRDASGRLLRTAGANGQAKLAGYLEDYALLADGLVALYEAEFDPKYLRAAVELAEVMLKHFADPSGPGFFFTADDHEQLIARTKDLHDGSTPSGNAVAVTVLLRLAKLCGRDDFAEKAEDTLRAYRPLMEEHPSACGQMLTALDFYLGPVQEIAVVGKAGDPEAKRVHDAIHSSFRPNRVVAFHDPATGEPPSFVPLLKDRPMVGDRVTVYVCENFVCQAPQVGADAALKALA